MPFRDRGADELLAKVLKDGSFRATNDEAVLREAEVVSTVVGTPVDEYLNPQLHLMMDLIDHYKSHFRSGQLFLLRSTIYPGTTDRVDAWFRQKEIDVDVAFCP